MQKLKEFITNNKKIIWIIASILLTIGINMSIYVVNNLIYFNGNQIIFLFLCGFIYIIFNRADEYKRKR